MFVHPRTATVEAFAPSALPDLTAIPASIPAPSILCLALVSVASAYSPSVRSESKNRPVRLVRTRPGRLLDAVCDPGEGTVSCPSDPAPVACIRSQSLGHPHCLSGLPTRFSDSRFTSQPFLALGFLLGLEYRMVD